MSRWIIFAGIAAMLVTGYFAIFFERGEGLLRSVRFIPAKLQGQVEAALKGSGAEWAQVEMDGQKAILSGLAPSEADREDAIVAAKHAAGPGGTWWGGITKVEAEQIKLAAPRKPYEWKAILGAGRRVSLQGYVPGQRFRRALVAEALKLFPGGVEDQMAVAGGQPTGDWLDAATVSLQQLARLQSGEARVEDTVVKVFGQSPDAAVHATILEALQNVKRPYVGQAEMSLANSADLPPPDEAPQPALTAQPPVQRLAAADCQKLVDEAMRSNIIRFESGSATLSASGLKVLETMTQTAMACSTLKLKISGHTDGTDRETAATDLSRKRASAAAKYLKDKGVEAGRIAVVAAGSSQPDPDAAADETSLNRRVEFSVVP